MSADNLSPLAMHLSKVRIRSVLGAPWRLTVVLELKCSPGLGAFVV
jgi:hypothetical protein